LLFTMETKTKNILKKSISPLFLVKWRLQEKVTKPYGLIRTFPTSTVRTGDVMTTGDLI